MNPEHLFVLCLATWRVANLLVNEKGPFDMFDWFRSQFGIRIDSETEEKYIAEGRENAVGEMLLCVWCTSIWVAAGVLALYKIAPVPMFIVCAWLSMSAVSCLIDRWSEG